MMNGADLVCEALLANDVDTWFANPGTSEMHLVAALDRRPEIRCVLGLFEGVVTGAADGYARMADKPAATLLHCGPGLANGLANLHNARRAGTPVINVVGDHASYHLRYDAPLTSDIESLASPMSCWVHRSTIDGDVALDVHAACHAAKSGPGVATLILPADVAWKECQSGRTAQPLAVPPRLVADTQVEAAVAALRARGRTMLLLSGVALREQGLVLAAAICHATGAQMAGAVSNGRIARGRGRAPLDLLPYPIGFALDMLSQIDTLICVGPPEPVAFFAYPGMPSRLVPEGCRIVQLGKVGDTLIDALAEVAAGVGAAPWVWSPSPDLPDMPVAGRLADANLSAIVARHLPDDAIVCEESITSARPFWKYSAGGARHDYLQLTGGAIGAGIPLAVGAAIACPGRRVVALQADGSGMYTVQGLWTQAREQLDVVTIILANRSYAVLHGEMRSVGVQQPGPNARRMLDLDQPALDWVSLARGLGVNADRADTTERFSDLLASALRQPGPTLIEATL